MKVPFLVALTTLAVALSGCADDVPDDTDIDPQPAPGTAKAELWHSDVPIDNSTRDFVDCGSSTHLYVEYRAGDDAEGDFTVNLFSERSGTNPYNSSIPGINVFSMTFSGAENATFEEDVSGSAGVWTLEVHRSRFHDGEFISRLTCA